MTIQVTPCDIEAFCSTSLSDEAIDALICVVQEAIGECVESSYPECLGKQIIIYTVCHMLESQKGSITQKRAANGASISQEFYGTGEGVKSTSAGRMLIALDSAGCYNALFTSPLLFTTTGTSNPSCYE